MTKIIGSGSAPVKAGDKFRATWSLAAGKVLPGSFIDSPAIARTLQEALPAAGFYTVSNPEAVRGDLVIVYDIRVTGGFPGHNVAGVAEALEKLPAFGGGWATDLQTLEPLALAGVSASELAAARDKAKAAGNTEAEKASWLDKLVGSLKTAGVVAVVAGAVVLFVVLKNNRRMDW